MRPISLEFAIVFFALAACSSSSTTQVVAGADAGATSGGSSSIGGQGTGGAAAIGQDLNCANYCAAVNTACVTGAQLQYKSSTSCLNSCPSFVLGFKTDTTSNTLGCRFSHALAALDSPDQNCAAAGPSGGGVCGTNCDAYCSLMAHICPTVYEDQATCNVACAAMQGVNDTAYHTNVSGDSLQCRIYHSTFAAEGTPEIHCVHASSLPTLPCAAQ